MPERVLATPLHVKILVTNILYCFSRGILFELHKDNVGDRHLALYGLKFRSGLAKVLHTDVGMRWSMPTLLCTDTVDSGSYIGSTLGI